MRDTWRSYQRRIKILKLDKKDKIGLFLFCLLFASFILSVLTVGKIIDYQESLIMQIKPSNFNALIYWIRLCSTIIFLIGLMFCLVMLILLSYARKKDKELNKLATL